MKSRIVFMCLFVSLVYAEVATKYKDVIINKHNELRRKQGGSNMNALVWNNTLAQEADAWIGRCRFEHENKGRGENLAFNGGADEAANIEQSFSDWYNEINNYRYQSKQCVSVCTHYTQLVWAATQEVGCAMKRCPSLSVFNKPQKNAWIFGCWYTPKGNYKGDFPYLMEGGPCSQCLEGQTCDNGLCTGVGKEKCEDKNDLCATYEASGQCKENKPYMERECRQSCKFCTGGPKKDCKDLSDVCARYGAAHCKSNVPWMKPNCMKFCGFC